MKNKLNFQKYVKFSDEIDDLSPAHWSPAHWSPAHCIPGTLYFAQRKRHGEPNPGARPRKDGKDLNQGSQSAHGGIGLVIAGVLGFLVLIYRSR